MKYRIYFRVMRLAGTNEQLVIYIPISDTGLRSYWSMYGQQPLPVATEAARAARWKNVEFI